MKSRRRHDDRGGDGRLQDLGGRAAPAHVYQHTVVEGDLVEGLPVPAQGDLVVGAAGVVAQGHLRQPLSGLLLQLVQVDGVQGRVLYGGRGQLQSAQVGPSLPSQQPLLHVASGQSTVHALQSSPPR